MLVTLSGIVIEVKPVQSKNAESPMLVTLSGIVIEVKLVQPRNAESPMLVTLSGIEVGDFNTVVRALNIVFFIGILEA